MNTDQLRTWSAISDQPASYYVNATEEERQTFREWVQGILRTQPITVTFTKADGAVREMLCTLQATVIPTPLTEGTSKKKPNPDVCSVWDVNQGAWRSFRWDRVSRIEFSLGQDQS